MAVTFARLRQLDESLDAVVGPPEGAGWYSLDTVVSGGHLDSWLEDLARDHDGQRDVAGAYLDSGLAGAVVTVPVSALVAERRVPQFGAGLWLHRHDEGWFDRVSYASIEVDVLADDPEAEHPDAVVVADQATLAERFAQSLVETLTPLQEAVRRRTPTGCEGYGEAWPTRSRHSATTTTGCPACAINSNLPNRSDHGIDPLPNLPGPSDGGTCASQRVPWARRATGPTA